MKKYAFFISLILCALSIFSIVCWAAYGMRWWSETEDLARPFVLYILHVLALMSPFLTFDW